jgi:hypothetical protein
MMAIALPLNSDRGWIFSAVLLNAFAHTALR